MMIILPLALLSIFCLRAEAGGVNCSIGETRVIRKYSCQFNSEQKIIFFLYPQRFIRVVCFGVDAINDTVLPVINFGEKISLLTTVNCPIPFDGFQVFSRRFHMKKLMHLNHTLYPHQEIRSHHLQGLESLNSLHLYHDNITYFDSNIFKFTPQLSALRLDGNNLLLYDDLFQNAHSLVTLYLTNNNISYLPRKVFNGLSYLTNLNLEGNKLRTIERGVFRDLISLLNLRLGGNLLNNLDANALESQRQLRRINLGNNKLVQLPKTLFQNCTFLTEIVLSENGNLVLTNIISNIENLKEVFLSNNNIGILQADAFSDCMLLETLDLQHNRLQFLPKNVFADQLLLKKLYLNNNEIKVLDNDIFITLESLEYLSLRHNHLTNCTEDLLVYLKYLKEIDLSFNKIHTIGSNMFSGKRNLIKFWINNNELDIIGSFHITHIDCENIQLLDFSNNKISEFPHSLMDILIENGKHKIRRNFRRDVEDSAKIIVDLRKNKISKIVFNSSSDSESEHPAQVQVKLSENPFNCDCQAFDLVTKGRKIKDYIIFDYDNLVCAGPAGLVKTSIEHVDVNELICTLENYCSQNYECSCSYKSATATIIVDCSNRNLTEYPQLILDDLPKYFHFVRLNRTELHFEDNLLEKGPRESYATYNITEIYLQRNNLNSFAWLPSTIEVLYLADNRLESLSPDILNSLNGSNIKELSLGNNPWRCDCSTKNFINYVWIHRSMISDAGYVKCNITRKELINLEVEDFCYIERGITSMVSLAILTCLCIFAISLIILLYFIYQEEILIWLYSKNTCLWLIKEETVDRNKIYDAFISFAHQDQEFVMEHLIPNLEKGTPAFKLCVHIRDWIPGEYIASQILSSINDSRRTLIVLSANFLESVWGKMEFRTAHTTAMEEGRARVIILIYGQIEMNNLEDELKAYLRTNTYIEWGDPWFWEKLRYALPRSRNRHKKPRVIQPRYTVRNNIELQE